VLKSIGLGGDGDEVDAIERVEARFGIAFDHAACARFATVGDVWRALLRELESGGAEAPRWPDFVRLLGEETVAEGELGEVGFETRLIA